ncbi:pathogenesis-related thaumatin-like protein 3.5 [Punica granatum]|uniref:Uncharacterized protein n=2 Tax=Punica granatum TaxID=22663 RepID=A0A218WLC3_PUNGR|nr:pathogenesis-related thaumatin-like protein 3.5 [Punica granatum]OWM73298.1 hypothetical protein CDL15_Pgr001412 [Punica granatum]PKI55685.1 hypothetical protein CRG98_023901 [Punica granatum]
MALSFLHLTIVFISLFFLGGANAKYFNLVNKCKKTIWPGIYSGAGLSQPYDSGFALAPGQTYLYESQYQWTGRIWARTGCRFDATGKGKCATGDCNGLLKCDGYEGTPPMTVALFSVDTPDDTYSVDLQHGFNVPVSVTTQGGTGQCQPSACIANLRRKCPTGQRVLNRKGRPVGCKSACDAFGDAANCCTDPFTAWKCNPTNYTKLFKAACPTAVTFLYDKDFTCKGSNFTVTFC